MRRVPPGENSASLPEMRRRRHRRRFTIFQACRRMKRFLSSLNMTFSLKTYLPFKVCSRRKVPSLAAAFSPQASGALTVKRVPSGSCSTWSTIFA